MAHDATTPVLDQEAFRGRDDDVALNSGTFNGGGGLNGDWTQDTDATFRVRFEVQETAGGEEKNETYSLEYNRNSGGWTAVTLTSPVQITTSGQYADTDATTQVIGDGSFVTGAGVEDPSTASAQITLLSQSTEVEYALTIDSAQVDDADSIQLRVVNGSGALDSYTQTPTITVNKPAAGARRIFNVS